MDKLKFILSVILIAFAFNASAQTSYVKIQIKDIYTDSLCRSINGKIFLYGYKNDEYIFLQGVIFDNDTTGFFVLTYEDVQCSAYKLICQEYMSYDMKIEFIQELMPENLILYLKKISNNDLKEIKNRG